MVTRFIATAAIGLMVVGTAALAQDNGNTAPKSDANPPAMMGRQGGGMMGSMDHAQMQRMMDNCNRMMESQMQKAPATDKKI
jgi:hypothetical protein